MENYKLYWFNTKEEGDEFLKEEGFGSLLNRFTKPGWYHYYEYSKYMPCGCCRDDFCELRDPEDYLSELRNKSRALKDDLLNNEADIMNVSDIIKSGMPV